MAVRIIDPNPSPEVEKLTVCPNCGIRLAYTPSDTREETRHDYTGDGTTYVLLDCPKCSKAIILRAI